MTALNLCIQLIKEHSAHLVGYETHVWTEGLFNEVIAAVVEARDGTRVRTEFANNFLNEYHDIAVYTVNRLSYVFRNSYGFWSCNYSHFL